MHSLCVSAEYYLYTDPDAALLKLRQFSEKVSEELCRTHFIELHDRDTQHSRIKELQYQQILPDNIASLFHNIRLKGNDGIHKGQSTSGKSTSALMSAFTLSKWLLDTYGEEVPADLAQHRFSPPPNLDARHAIKEQEEAFAEKEKAYEQKIAELQKMTPAAEAKVKERGNAKAYNLSLSEEETRLLYIDPHLRAAGWEVDTLELDYKTKKVLPQKGRNMAIAEWPVKCGYADYALFIGLELYGIVEAKKYKTDISTDLTQAKRYAKDLIAKDPMVALGEWRSYKVPFLFSTNGRKYLKQIETKSGIWFLDVRKERNNARVLQGWYSPEGLEKLRRQDLTASETKLKEKSPDFLTDASGLSLRDYQMKAIAEVENSLLNNPEQRRLLLAMATGTGKTRTIIGLCYRLISTNRFRRILFLVDRRLLADQAFGNFKDNKVEELKTFGDYYEIAGLKQAIPELDTRMHFATVQSMVHRLFYAEDPTEVLPVDTYDCIIVDEAHRGYLLDKEQDDEELEFKDQLDYVSKYRMVLDYFDVHAVGLTATPALHTTEIFGKPVYNYSYREAVIDGWLIDHEPPIKIKTQLSEHGITFNKGESPEAYDPETGEVIELDQLEDELNFEIDGFNKKVLSPSFNETVVKELVQRLDPEGEEKTLVFAARDDHADDLVKLFKEEFARIGADVVDEAIMKITGKTDKVGEQVQRFKNEKYPNIVVTVDLLTTGIDVPKICNLVFMRRVRSRILYEQMVGRATRLCGEIGKEIFHIYDAVRLYEALEDYTKMKPLTVKPLATLTQLIEELPHIKTPARIQQQLDQIISKLQRKKSYIIDEHLEKFQYASDQEDLPAFIEMIKNMSPEEAVKELPKHTQTFKYLDRTKRPTTVTYLSDHPDQLIAAEQGYGAYARPEDYLEGFQKYIEENKNKISALKLVCTKPAELDRKSLKELKLALDSKGFNARLLNKAWKSTKNEDIAADIISYVRTHALGSSLLSHEERIEKAMATIRSLKDWNKIQSKWLDRIEKQLLAESILQKSDLDQDPFSEAGGYKRLNKVFNNDLDNIIKTINENLYNQSA